MRHGSVSSGANAAPQRGPGSGGLSRRSDTERIDYLIVVPVPFYAGAGGTFAGESAFCEHLRLLRRMLAPEIGRLVVAAPRMAEEEYARNRAHLGHLDPELDKVAYVPLHPAGSSALRFWIRESVPAFARMMRAVLRAGVVHAGPSHDLRRPIEFTALVLGALLRRKTICVQDIDQRQDAAMNRATGRWGIGTYLRCRWIHDPLRALQMRIAVRISSLCLLKGGQLCADYGRGRETVKNFLDAAFSREHLIEPPALERKLARLADERAPLELVYFGRLTPYKGVDRCLEALASISREKRTRLRFSVIGAGDDAARLRELAASRDLEDCVRFEPPRRFGRELFERLQACDLLLATPLSEDTPRSALDAFATGIPILAFRTAYYADLAAASGAVDLVAWPSMRELAARIEAWADDKRALVPLARNAVAFARENTQEEWLGRRIAWTRALFGSQAEARRAG